MHAGRGRRPVGRFPLTRFSIRAILITTLAVTGCTRLPAADVKRIQQAHQAYSAGRYSQSQQLVTPVIAQYPTQPDVAEALYVRGLAWLKTGKTDSARADFEAALRVADREDLIPLLHAQLGNLDYEAARYQSAIAHYRRADSDLPARPPSDRVLKRYAEALQRIGRFDEAKRVQARLLLRFPQSQTATQVRQTGSWAKDYYTIQCGVYTKPDAARRAAADLSKRGVNASAWREERNGLVRHIVRSGRYQTHAEASQALAAVRRVVPDAFIVP
ncbi:MAG TPA: tetratricopeptide repeat protein [Phycisphaerae bacterium]|nr:tetratricopeptide repeat protein [Phycisphaerae bacterium]